MRHAVTTSRHSGTHDRRYPSGSLLGKLRKRGIIGALAAVIGSGWLVYEVVHFILVDHYHLPEVLKDIAIISTLCVLVCTLTWRWFRGEKRKRRIKWEYVLLPAFILTGAFLNGSYLLRINEKHPGYDDAAQKETSWKNSLAILPFVNMSADPEQEYFCDGLTEELITKLSQIRELKVAARTSAFMFKGESADIREVGKRLRVENVLEGSVRKSGSQVRITAQLINVADGYHLWSETYDRQVEDILAVQEEIARSVAGTLQVTLLGEKRIILEAGNSEAYNAFLMGQYFYRQQTRESLEKAAGYYEQVVKLDPGFARAWAGLGATYAFQAGAGYVPPKKGYGRAKLAIKKALALDENLAYAHRVNGWIQMSYDWDWAAAEASYKKAISLEPGREDVEMAQLAVALGRFEDAAAMARKAVELDPISVQPYATLALAYWYGGRWEEAVASYRKILEFIPDYPAIRSLIGQVYLSQSRPQEALAELVQVKDPFWRLPGLAMAYYLLGRMPESEAAQGEFIEKYQAGGAYNVAQVYAFWGDAGQAFNWLDRAYDQHDGGIFLVKVDPLMENLRHDARFHALVKKMRLPARDSTSSAPAFPETAS
jgi:TolB-like protein/cytochrome c-type biogenesis protein CcmH/NrfG